MRILADENIPAPAIAALRAFAHDVAWIRVDAPGASDAEILGRATAEQRIVLTLDKDFGELAFRARLPATCGVVLLRITPPVPGRLTALVTAVFGSGRDFRGVFAVAEEGRLRLRPLP